MAKATLAFLGVLAFLVGVSGSAAADVLVKNNSSDTIRFSYVVTYDGDSYDDEVIHGSRWVTLRPGLDKRVNGRFERTNKFWFAIQNMDTLNWYTESQSYTDSRTGRDIILSPADCYVGRYYRLRNSVVVNDVNDGDWDALLEFFPNLESKSCIQVKSYLPFGSREHHGILKIQDETDVDMGWYRG